ncbi:MAG: hypothetical protein EZS28_044469 [Streblomastix strix]|uniref:Uncharacterized protein n=1 Tax=Streblomastix strix TaxID=222440 RepID=A0A5J4TNK8_9EUKA|nr:MAG: hypothetical protein EZS28_044469 [Streblomastix strix]
MQVRSENWRKDNLNQNTKILSICNDCDYNCFGQFGRRLALSQEQVDHDHLYGNRYIPKPLDIFEHQRPFICPIPHRPENINVCSTPSKEITDICSSLPYPPKVIEKHESINPYRLNYMRYIGYQLDLISAI